MKAYSLPIHLHRKRILDALASNSVIIVQSPTGSGKTTQLPIILYEAGYSQLGIIGITQPRRIATLGVSDFIAKQLHSSLGGLVGYKMRFEDKTSSATRLKVMTDGTLLQELKSDPLLSNYSVLMVDEAHERTLNIDFILGLLKQILKKRSDFKIIISSATLNVEAFSRYFNQAPIIFIDTPTYPVTVVYDPPENDTEEVLISKILNRVETAILTDRKSGDILIFLPGERSIRVCIQSLQISSVKKRLWILPLYGMLAKEEQERVFKKTPFGKTKVVVATNIAETSITIDGIRTVIDSGLLKENIYNQRTYTNSLVQDLVSKAAAEQRKGRAGRTASGICYRLYSKEAFNHRPHYGTEEIFRTDLSEVVLRMAGLGIVNFLDFDFISKPARSGITSGLETLSLLGAVDVNNKITSIGQMLLKFPLLPRHGRIMVESVIKYPNVLVECAIVCAFLSTNSPYVLPLGEEVEARMMHQKFQNDTGDFIGYQELFYAFEHAIPKEEFCSQHYLDLRTMQEIVNVKYQLEEVSHSLGAIIGQGGNVKEYLLCCMAGLVQSICVQTGHNLYRSYTTERIMIHPGSVMFKKTTPYIVAGEIIKTSRMYARGVNKIEKSWIEEVSPASWQVLKNYSKPMKKFSREDNKANKFFTEPPKEGVWVGDIFFEVSLNKGRKPHLVLDWEKIWEASQNENVRLKPLISTNKRVKAFLKYRKLVVSSGFDISFAVEYALNCNPEKSLIKHWNNFKPFNSQAESGLVFFLEQAQNLGKICLNTRREFVGFLSVTSDSSGCFYFKPTAKFSVFLRQTQESLELLENMGLIVRGTRASLLLNQVLERLIIFWELT